MTELSDLYQEVILDHNRRPRNYGPLEGADRRADGHNPLCGDRITVYLKMDGEIVSQIAFDGSGCAISKASASLMTEAMEGLTKEEIAALFERFHAVVTGRAGGPAETQALGKLAALSGVSEFPVRVKCATLAWHTLMAALSGKEQTVSTE